MSDALEVPPVKPLTDGELPRVSIVILNWNGRKHLRGCFDSLAALDYPEGLREVLLIDNGSDDGSVEEVRAQHAWVHLEVNARNLGFSAGCNQGAELAKGPEVLVFLNNDIRVEPGFLRALVAPIVRGVCQSTTAKMLSWDGKLLNSTGGGMNFHGIGIQRGYLEEPSAQYDVPRRTLFACGGAMAIDPKVFLELGGLDEEFFAYYEDVDLGWRSWVHGHSVQYEPLAVCYHHHSSTSRRLPVERLRLLQVRNPLLACFKNYDTDNLRRVLPAMLGLAIRRAFHSANWGDLSELRVENLRTLPREGRFRNALTRFFGRGRRKLALDPIALADLVAINDLLGNWDHWMKRRLEVQARRARGDEKILPLLLRPLWCIEQDPGYQELQDGLVQFLGLDRLFENLTSMQDDPKT